MRCPDGKAAGVRVQRTVTDRETDAPHRITDSSYSYDVSGTITSDSRALTDATGTTWDTQCFTYDVMGELVNAWTSNITPDRQSTGCKAANGTTWGYDTDYTTSSGPVADAPDAATDTTSPDTALTSSLADTAPASGTVSTGSTAYRQSFTFDWLGNRATLTEHDTADATKNVTYTYGHGKTLTSGTKVQPHTMTSISSTPTGKSSSYTYDDSGNTTDRDLSGTTQDLVWTSENKLDSITSNGAKTKYVYDADGNRILENSSSGSTLYLGETELTTNATGSITKASRSYTQAGAPTVVRTTTNGSTTGHKLSVLLTDHLGTANTSVDVASAQTVTRRAFKPYGETRGTKPTAWPNKRSYLGVGIDDATTGLTRIGAREYDQNSGRFISADPIIDISDPLQMNGYAYSDNSPVSQSDPSGLCMRDICGDGYPVAGDGEHAGYTGQHKGENACSYCNGPSGGYNYNPAEIFPGVTVSTQWKGRDEFIRIFYRYVHTSSFNDGRLPGYLTDGTNPEAASQQLGYWGLSTCWEMRSCPKGVMSTFRNMSMGFGGRISAIAGSPFHPSAEKPLTSGGAGRAVGGCNCFLAGTDVLMSNGTTKDIEDVKLGENVLATDPETGETVPKKVTRLIRTDGDKYFNELSIATTDGVEKLTATHEHPFWSPSQHDWVPAGELKSGMTLRTDKGDTVIVTGNRSFTKHARTYNLTVEDLHTYYVLAGTTPVLVHNSTPCEPEAVNIANHAAQRAAAGDGSHYVRGVDPRAMPEYVDGVITGEVPNVQVRYLKRGRVGYWDPDKGAVVIEDPGTTGGTVFTPKNGKQYFDNELE